MKKDGTSRKISTNTFSLSTLPRKSIVGCKPDWSNIMMKNNQLMFWPFHSKKFACSLFFCRRNWEQDTQTSCGNKQTWFSCFLSGKSCKRSRKEGSTGHVRPPSWRSKRRNHSLSSLYTKWSFANAESSTLSVSEVDNNSFCQTVEVKVEKKHCANHLALYGTFHSWLHSLQPALGAAFNDGLLSWKHHYRYVADFHCHWKSLKLRKNIPVYPHQPVSELSSNFNTYAKRELLYTLRIYKFLYLYCNRNIVR